MVDAPSGVVDDPCRFDTPRYSIEFYHSMGAATSPGDALILASGPRVAVVERSDTTGVLAGDPGAYCPSLHQPPGASSAPLIRSWAMRSYLRDAR